MTVRDVIHLAANPETYLGSCKPQSALRVLRLTFLFVALASNSCLAEEPNSAAANPAVTDPKVADQLLWVVKGQGEPAWAVGGSYHVIRLIRMDIEAWDDVSLHRQQTTIGRYRADGAPLGMARFTDIPDYRKDPHGTRVPLGAHSAYQFEK